MKHKKWLKRLTRKEKRDWLTDLRNESRWMKNARLALKHAKKALHYIEKENGVEDCECGLWFDQYDGGGYSEDCRAHNKKGWCERHHDDADGCPLLAARKLITSLGDCKLVL